MNIEFRLLGPFEVLRDGEPLPLGGAKQRALLARLLLSPNQPVPVDRLVEDLWGSGAPATAAHSVQVYVSSLRKVLGAGAIRREGGGYVLDVSDADVDAAEFAALVVRARDENPARAAATLADALALWRGPALTEFRYESFAQHAIAELEEQRLTAVEDRLEAHVSAGGGAELVGELQALVGEHPLRERLRAHLMLALYRAGRQAEALAAYQEARETLRDELGIDPGPGLQDLYRAILNQDEALRGSAVPESNLPTPPNELIGRERELAEVVELLRSSRLLTVTGPGGSGKTRLALAVAAELVTDFPDGVWHVPLAGLRDAELLEPTVAAALDAREELAAFLRPKRLLLVLDNLEQLLPAVASVVAALLDAPGVSVLATSRERLAIGAEQEYVLPMLRLDEGVALFTARARQLKPDFDPDPDVAEIARRLTGLPLALELAAARIKIATPRQILERLGRSLELLTSGRRDVPERQRTLRAAIEWSHDLLAPEEQSLFARLAVFAESFDLEAAEAVADADAASLQTLVDKSLLQQADQGRLAMLETIRELAGERLEAGSEAAATRRRHAVHYLSVAEDADGAFRSGRGGEPFARLDQEVANVRAAIAWIRSAVEPELLLRFATALWGYWAARGYVAEGRPVIEEAVASADEPPPRALLGLCTMRLLAGVGAAELMPTAEIALEACEAAGDDASRAQAWNLVGKLRASVLAQLGSAEQAFDRALAYAQAAHDPAEQAESIWGLTLCALTGPLPVEAGIARTDELLRIAADEPATRAFCLSARGALEAMAGDVDTGRQLLAEGTASFERLGHNVWVANNAQLSFIVEMLAGAPEAAAHALRKSYERLAEMGEQGFLSTIAGFLAQALCELGDDEEADRFSRIGETAAAADDAISQILWRSARAKVLARRGDPDRALALVREAIDLVEATDLVNTQGDALLDLAAVLGLAGREDEARAAAAEAARRFAAKGNVVSLERARDRAAASTRKLRSVTG